MKIARLVFFILILSGKTVAAAPGAMSLADALKRGLSFSPEVQKAESELKAARAEYNLARSKVLPTIDLNASSGTIMTSDRYGGGFSEAHKARLDADQSLWTGGVITAALRAAIAKEDAAKERVKLARQDYAFKIVEAYFKTAQAQTLLDIAKDNREVLKNYLAITTRYAAIGRAKGVDKLQAEASYHLSESDVLEAESALESNRQDLIRFVGEEPGTDQALAPKLRLENYEIGSIDKLYNQALTYNNEIRARELELKSLTDLNKAKMVEHRPRLSLKASWGFDSPTEANWIREPSEAYSVMLNLKVPLFSGFSSFAQSEQYSQQRVQLEKDLMVKRLELRNSLATALTTMQKDFQRLRLTQLSATSAKKAMDVAVRDYRNGLLNSTEVLTIQRNRFETDRKNTAAQYSYNLQILNLRYDLGDSVELAYGGAK